MLYYIGIKLSLLLKIEEMHGIHPTWAFGDALRIGRIKGYQEMEIQAIRAQIQCGEDYPNCQVKKLISYLVKHSLTSAWQSNSQPANSLVAACRNILPSDWASKGVSLSLPGPHQFQNPLIQALSSQLAWLIVSVVFIEMRGMRPSANQCFNRSFCRMHKSPVGKSPRRWQACRNSRGFVAPHISERGIREDGVE